MIIILSHLQMPENLGFAARSMKNFGLTELRLVQPGLRQETSEWEKNENSQFQPDIFWEKAQAVAKGGAEIIKNATIYNSITEATDEIDIVYALSARRRDVAKEVITPRHCIEEILNFKGKSALLFGPEASGLSNKDIILCKKMVEIETISEYSSINLGMSVGIMAHLFFSALKENYFVERERKIRNKVDLISTNHLVNFLEQKLTEADYFKVLEKQEGMMINISNLLTRASLTKAECNTLYGIFTLIK